MKTIIFLVIILFVQCFAFGQTTDCYNEKGILQVDTNFSIDINRLDDFEVIEDLFFPLIYNSIDYFKIAAENEIEGLVIVKFILKENQTYEYSIIKSEIEIFNESIKTGIEKSIGNLLSITSDMKKPFEFYVPIKFEMNKDTYKQDLKSNNAITIKGTFYPIVPASVKEETIINE